MNKHTMTDLKQMQSLPLSDKIKMTERRIQEWIDEFGTDGVYVSFSGGKDSTVLVDIVRNRMGYKEIPLVFVDVPTQYPELKDFVKTFDNVVILKPKISFMEVCEKYGFPLISKEVSDVVAGARKYLTKVAERIDLAKQSRAEQSRAEQIPYHYHFERLTGTGKYQTQDAIPNIDARAIACGSRGGRYDNKYRKLRGIGEYAKRQNNKSAKSQNGDFNGYANDRQQNKGEYP